jgi:hypothetical protein
VLYAEGLDLRLDDVDRVVERTAGVTASFVKELMRKAALLAAEGDPDGADIPVVTDEHVNAALDELLAEGNALTRALLGGARSDAGEEDFEAGAGFQRRMAVPAVFDVRGGTAVQFHVDP